MYRLDGWWENPEWDKHEEHEGDDQVPQAMSDDIRTISEGIKTIVKGKVTTGVALIAELHPGWRQLWTHPETYRSSK